jgi:hypothetical protein
MDTKDINLNYKEFVKDIYQYLKNIKQHNIKHEQTLYQRLDTLEENQNKILLTLDDINNKLTGISNKISTNDDTDITNIELLNNKLNSISLVNNNILASEYQDIEYQNISEINNTILATEYNTNNILATEYQTNNILATKYNTNNILATEYQTNNILATEYDNNTLLTTEYKDTEYDTNNILANTKHLILIIF